MFRKLRRRLTGEPAPLPEGCEFFHESFTEFIDRFGVDGPVCHVGAKDHGKTEAGVAGWRGLFDRCPTKGFVGIDIFPGVNVDRVADICGPGLFDAHPDLRRAFGFVYCSALLEHVKDPFGAARNIAELLRDGGQILYTGPWVWGYHAYPDDYWRMSFPALGVLFPQVTWKRKWYSGTRPKVGITFPDAAIEKELFAWNRVERHGARISDRALPYLNINAVGVLGRP